MARKATARALGQEGEAIIKAPGDLADRRRHLVSEHELRRHRLGPLDEQPDALIADQRPRLALLAGVRDRQRSHRPDALPGDRQRLAAGRKYPQLRASAQKLTDNACARDKKVLAVVEHQ
jgi:hypothetical protein